MRVQLSLAAIVVGGFGVVACGGGPAPEPLVPVVTYRLPENAQRLVELCRVELDLVVTTRKVRENNQERFELCVAAERAAAATPVLIRLKGLINLDDEPLPQVGPGDSQMDRQDAEQRRREHALGKQIAEREHELLNVLVHLSPAPDLKGRRWQGISVMLVHTMAPTAPEVGELQGRVKRHLVEVEHFPSGAVVVESRSVDLAAMRAQLESPLPVVAAASPVVEPPVAEPVVAESVLPVVTTDPPATRSPAVAAAPRLLWQVYGIALGSLLANVGFTIGWWRRRRREHRSSAS